MAKKKLKHRQQYAQTAQKLKKAAGAENLSGGLGANLPPGLGIPQSILDDMGYKGDLNGPVKASLGAKTIPRGKLDKLANSLDATGKAVDKLMDAVIGAEHEPPIIQADITPAGTALTLYKGGECDECDAALSDEEKAIMAALEEEQRLADLRKKSEAWEMYTSQDGETLEQPTSDETQAYHDQLLGTFADEQKHVEKILAQPPSSPPQSQAQMRVEKLFASSTQTGWAFPARSKGKEDHAGNARVANQLMWNHVTNGRYFAGWGVTGAKSALDVQIENRANAIAIRDAAIELGKRFFGMDFTFITYQPRTFARPGDAVMWANIKKGIEAERKSNLSAKGKKQESHHITAAIHTFVLGRDRMNGRVLYVDENVLDETKVTWRHCFIELLQREKLITAEGAKLAAQLIFEGRSSAEELKYGERC